MNIATWPLYYAYVVSHAVVIVERVRWNLTYFLIWWLVQLYFLVRLSLSFEQFFCAFATLKRSQSIGWCLWVIRLLWVMGVTHRSLILILKLQVVIYKWIIHIIVYLVLNLMWGSLGLVRVITFFPILILRILVTYFSLLVAIITCITIDRPFVWTNSICRLFFIQITCLTQLTFSSIIWEGSTVIIKHTQNLILLSKLIFASNIWHNGWLLQRLLTLSRIDINMSHISWCHLTG